MNHEAGIQKASQPIDKAPVHCATGELADSLSRLSSDLHELRNRLNFVLRPSPPTANAGNGQSLSPVPVRAAATEGLYGMGSQVREMIEVVNDIAQRLEI